MYAFFYRNERLFSHFCSEKDILEMLEIVNVRFISEKSYISFNIILS